MKFEINGMDIGPIMQETIQDEVERLMGPYDHEEIDRIRKATCCANKRKRYDVYLNGIAEQIYGDGLHTTDDGYLYVYADAAEMIVAAVFKEWDYFKIVEEECS